MHKDINDTDQQTEDLERRRNEAKTRSNLEEKIRQEDIKWLMSDKRGRRFIHSLLSRANVYSSTFNPNSPTVTAFNEGRRREGLELLADINIVPELYIQMLRENKG